MHTIAPFLTGLGLFFCGVHFVSSRLVPLTGRRLRNVLSRLGGQPILAALFGSFAGAVTQSTNAVTSVMIGLVNAGLIDKRRAILIPIWSNVGTSLLVILVAVDLRLAASYLVALAGVAVYSGLDRSDRIRHAVGTLLGLGLLFIGMQMLKEGIEPLRDGLLQGGLALHILLTALADAADTDNLSEREMTLALLTHRDELMERIRQRVLREDPDMPAKAQEALFAATMLFERIIWLARRTALLFSPERGAEPQPLAVAL